MQKGWRELPEPGPGQAAVAIRAVGLNQSENRYLSGTHFPPEQFPACISHEAVGEIVELGPEENGPASGKWKVGDRVAFLPMLVDRAGMGVLRDFGVYKQSVFLPVPEVYSDCEGAAYWMAVLTMAGAMDMAGLGPHTSSGKTIVFTAAAGGMGTLALKLARAWDAETIATTRHQAKVEQLSAVASRVAVVRTVEELTSALRALSPNGVDVIIDPLGGSFVGASIESLVPGRSVRRLRDAYRWDGHL